MQDSAEFGSLDLALANGRRLLTAEPEAAAEQARAILDQDGENRPALRLLGQALRRLGRDDEAAKAEQDAIKAASNERALVGAAQAIQAGDLARAEHAVRPYLDRHPDDPAALRLMGEIAARLGFIDKALDYLRGAIKFAPTYVSARMKLAYLLFNERDFPAALEQLDQLMELDPDASRAGLSKATTLIVSGEYEQAARLYQQLTESMPEKPALWISYAHVLNTIGRFEESIAAYRRALALQASHGEAWWSLANLKMAKFSADDVTTMLAALDEPDLDDKSRIQLHFALGKALEDAGDYAQSFAHYSSGNRLQAAEVIYDPATKHELVLLSEATFTGDYFKARTGAGAEAADPIFVLGMPRAGSTLVEQILASHSMIEGTGELQYMPALRRLLTDDGEKPLPIVLAQRPRSDLTELGEKYLLGAHSSRRTDRPLFVDKLPNNWESLGLILTILPNARIVDARRHPMACGFSNFKQLYARGQEFSYSLDWMGRYYVDYVRMMRHFDELFPGRIHRVINERLIDHPDEEIASLLDYIGVPFEKSCLRFYETQRPVRTPSAEQVRQPLNRRGVEQWRNFEPWLDELKAALGPVLDAYPDVPERFADQ